MIPSSQRSATYRERQRVKMQRMEKALTELLGHTYAPGVIKIVKRGLGRG